MQNKKSSLSNFKIEHKQYDLTDLKHQDAQEKIKHAREYGKSIICECNFFSPCTLISALRNEVFYLKSYPNDGVNHSKDCRFYNNGMESTSTHSAFLYNEAEDVLDVKLDVAFIKKSRTKSSKAIHSLSNSTPRNSTSLLGLLRKIWYESSLYIYRPDKNYDSIFDKVLFRNVVVFQMCCCT